MASSGARAAAAEHLANLHAGLNQSPRAQAIAQFQRAADQSPRVTQLATLAAGLQRPAGTSGVAQREASMDDEDLMPGVLDTVQRAAASTRVDGPAGHAPDRTGMPDRLKAGVEALSGLPMDDVRVHYGSPEPAQLQAHAFARGTDIHLAPGQERHLPHEAWHVVQQAQGRVAPTMQFKTGVPINDDAGLEREADVMGALASRGGGAPAQMVAAPTMPALRRGAPGVVQAYRQETSEGGDALLHSQELHPRMDENGGPAKIAYAAPPSPSSGADFLVADDSSMAVHDTTDEPKEFFAIDAVFDAANTMLEHVDSAVYLAKAGGSVTFRNPRSGLTRMSAIKPERVEDADDEQFANLFGDVCIFAANKIMGNDGRKPGEAILQSGSIEASAPIAPVRNIGPAIENLAAYLSAETPQPDNSAGVISEALTAMAQQRDGGEEQERLPGEAYGRALHSGLANMRAGRIGVNRSARPGVGEGFATFSIDSDNAEKQKDYTSGTAIDRGARWEYHYAAVVAKSTDGRDYMTLQNYNRTDDAVAIGYDYLLKKYDREASAEAQRLELQGKSKQEVAEGVTLYLKKYHDKAKSEYIRVVELRDARSWFFRMYGSGVRQSFHDQQAATGDFVNPLTLRVRRDYSRLITLQKAQRKMPFGSSTIKHGPTRVFLDELERRTDEVFEQMEKAFQRSEAGGEAAAQRIYQDWLANFFVPYMARALHAAKRFPSKMPLPTTLAELRMQAGMAEPAPSWLQKKKQSATSALSDKAKADAAERAPSLAALSAAIANVPDDMFSVRPPSHRTETSHGRDARDRLPGSEHGPTSGSSHPHEPDLELEDQAQALVPYPMLPTRLPATRDMRVALRLNDLPSSRLTEIDSILRRRLFATHPDRGGDEDHFKQIVADRELLRRILESRHTERREPLALTDADDRAVEQQSEPLDRSRDAAAGPERASSNDYTRTDSAPSSPRSTRIVVHLDRLEDVKNRSWNRGDFFQVGEQLFRWHTDYHQGMPIQRGDFSIHLRGG